MLGRDGVVPLFAFANAGIPVVDGLYDALGSAVTWGLELAFGTDPLADVARIGILFGSIVAGAVGYVILNVTLPRSPHEADG